MRKGGSQDGRGNGYRQERDRVGPELRAEPALDLRPREIRNDDHPEGLGPEHEHEVHPVGSQEAVGLVVPAELVRQKRACDCGRQAQRHI